MNRNSPGGVQKNASGAILLLGLIGVAFGLSFWVPLTSDDLFLVLQEPRVIGPWPGWGAFLLRTFTATGEYEPLIFLIHRLIYRFSGSGPFLYHLTSLGLHWLNAVLVFSLYRRFTGRWGPALAGALLFALLPSHVETLVVSTFKKHLLVAFFGLSLLNIQFHARNAPLRRAACWLLLALALLCKESALLIPWISLLSAETLRRTEKKPAPRDPALHIGLFAAALAYILIRLTWLPRQYPHPPGSAPANLLTSGKCFLWYFAEWLRPWSFCFEHSLAPVASQPSREWLLIIFGLGALAAGLALVWRRDKIAGLGLAWAGMFLLPFINLIPFLNFSLVANRYHYLASIGFFLFVIRAPALLPLGRRAAGSKWPYWLGVLPPALLYSAIDLNYTGLFLQPLELLSRSARCAPDNPRAHAALGAVYMQALQWEPARAEFEQALRLDPEFPMVPLHLALVYARTGQLDQAIALTRSEAQAGRYPMAAWSNLGVFYMEAGRWRAAQDALGQALRLNPDDAAARLNLGICRLRLGDLEAARQDLLFAAAAPPSRFLALRSLGELAAKEKKYEDALAYYRQSLSLNYFHIETLHELGALYIRLGRKDSAETLYQGAIDRLRGEMSALRSVSQELPAAYAQAEKLLSNMEKDRKELRLGRK